MFIDNLLYMDRRLYMRSFMPHAYVLVACVSKYIVSQDCRSIARVGPRSSVAPIGLLPASWLKHRGDDGGEECSEDDHERRLHRHVYLHAHIHAHDIST